MNSKPLGEMENDMKKWMNVFLVMFILVNLVGCGNRWESKDNTDMERDGFLSCCRRFEWKRKS